MKEVLIKVSVQMAVGNFDWESFSILFIRPLIFYFITLMIRDHSFKALHQESRGSENYQSTSSNLSQMKSSCNSQRL